MRSQVKVGRTRPHGRWWHGTGRTRHLCGVVLGTAALAVGMTAVAAPALADPVATTSMTVTLHDSTGAPLSGAPVVRSSGVGWYSFGTTDANGQVTGQVPTSTTKVQIAYALGTETQSVNLATDPEVDFHTSKVTILSGVDLAYTTGHGWQRFSSPGELLPGTYRFADNSDLSQPFQVTVGDQDITAGALHLLDHTGHGLAGGSAQYYLGGWQSLPGTTDASGTLVFSIPGDSPNLSMAMFYGGTRNQQSRTQLAASNFTFQTALANVRLENADGNPLDTGTAAYYAGGWHTIGDTSGGVVSQEMLPGSYPFALGYNHTREQRNDVAISGPTTDVVFQTGRLTAYFSQPFGWNNAQPYAFDGPTMEFLPGSIQLDLAGCRTAPISIAAGDHLVKTGIVATLADSTNHPLAGGSASVYAGGWQPVGTTDASGRSCTVVDGMRGNTAVAMTYDGTREQVSQNAQTSSIYGFRTADVSVDLESSDGNPLDTGSASYYAGGWHSIGNTSGGAAHVQMLPGSYSFAMTYNGTREQLNHQQVSGTSSSVVFQTSDVAVRLRDSDGHALDTGSASYYAGGWHSIGDTSGGAAHVQMLPGSYSFAMTYKGTREQQNHVPVSGTSDSVTFQTGKVHSDSGAATSYYAGGWRSFMQDMELLPGRYTFHFDDGTANARETLAAGVTNHIH